MNYSFISRWLTIERRITNICNILHIPAIKIVPIKISFSKGIVFAKTIDEKYVIKWNNSISSNNYQFTNQFLEWIKCFPTKLVPDYITTNHDLYIDGIYHFVYKYIDSGDFKSDIDCVKTLSQFHNMSKKYNNPIQKRYDYEIVNMWYGNLMNSILYILNDNIINYENYSMHFDLNYYLASLKKELKDYIEVFDQNKLYKQMCVCHGDVNRKNFIFNKNGKCYLIDMDTLSFGLPVRELFSYLKLLCMEGKCPGIEHVLEYDSINKISTSEYALLKLMCNPVLNIYYCFCGSDSDDKLVDYELLNGIVGVYDEIIKEKGI